MSDGSSTPLVAALDELSGALHAREHSENFPVALRVLPAGQRCDLRAVYAVARTIDTIGDELPGDRLALLDAYESDLHLIWSGGHPSLAVNRQLAVTVRRAGLSEQPFRDLVEANRVDQRVVSYASWTDLRSYCTLSADPVGRIVLELADAATDERRAWSDDVCTALQVLEHCQDVGEDHRRGRIYLPADERATYSVMAADLGVPVAGPGLRGLVMSQVARCEALLESGRPLVRSLRGGYRLAVAGFVAGGLASAAALRAADGEVLSELRSPSRFTTARFALRLAAGA